MRTRAGGISAMVQEAIDDCMVKVRAARAVIIASDIDFALVARKGNAPQY